MASAALAGLLLLWQAGLPPAPTPLPGSPLAGRERAAPAAAAAQAAPKRAATVEFEGEALRRPVIDTIVTRSGHWRLRAGARDDDVVSYVWTLDENPAFVRFMACKRAFTAEARDRDRIEETPISAEIRHAGRQYRWRMSVVQGACRIVQNAEPVAPRPEWLRAAVAERRIPAYRRERSWLPGRNHSLGSGKGSYDPTSLGGSSSGNNYVGVTSPQGGEYPSSRGFVHDADARIVDAVLHGEPIGGFWPGFTAYSFYSLAQPQGAVWSLRNHVTADPQMPFRGDRPWEIAFAGQRVRPDIDSVMPAAGWGRDVAHLENSGFVHWILTEDPVAGLVVQRQAAYALASFLEWQRKRGDTAYRAQTIQERGTYNLLSALWKARDVARRARSGAGTVLWDARRVDKMAADTIADIDATLARPAAAAPRGPSDAYLRRLANVPLSELSDYDWELGNGRRAVMRGVSAFMLPQYGKEPLYLWTRDGDPTVRRWFGLAARHVVLRVLHVGGARGIDRSEDLRGSAFPLGPAGPNRTAAMPPFSTDRGWAQWVRGLPLTKQPTDRYDGAAIHTVTQMEGLLLLAKAAGLKVPELDAAIARMAADRKRTSALRYPNLDMAKHWAAAQ